MNNENRLMSHRDEALQTNRSGIGADEKISIEFTGAEFDEILKYQGYAGATTVQNAVMNAISIAFDDADWK